MSAYETTTSVICAATRGMRDARMEFDAATSRGEYHRAQDAANEMATFACALGQAARELETYFAELRGAA